MNHFTNRKGYNAISAASTWRFLTKKPPGGNPAGAYFTTLAADHPKLANKLMIPRSKTAYVFIFADVGDLTPLRGGRGNHVFYSPADYDLVAARQHFHGKT